MSHARATVRNAVVALLAAGGTTAGARVFSNPVRPRRTFPALVVEIMGESQAAQTMPAGPGRVIERRVVLQVSAEVVQSDGYEDACDELCAQVETLIASAGVPGVKSISPIGYMPDFSADGQQPVAIGRQRFEVLLYTPQGSPNTFI